MKTLKDRLIYARELRGYSQAELAKLAKCSQGTIGNVESGDRLTLRNLVLVARVLKVSADWLFDGKGPKPEKSESISRDTPGQFRYSSLQSIQDAQLAVHTNPVAPSDALRYDPWTIEAITIFKPLTDAQKAAAVARLKEFVGYLAPPGDGQALSMAV